MSCACVRTTRLQLSREPVWISRQRDLHRDEGHSTQTADPVPLQKQRCNLGKAEP